MQTLREARIAKGLTQSKLASLIPGYNQVNISCIERGLTLPWPETRKQLHKIFGELDWSNYKKYRFKPVTKQQAEQKLKEFTECLLGLSDRDRLQFIKNAEQHLNTFK